MPVPPHQEQQVVLVTGCTKGGIGHELCKAFAAQGCRVFAASRRRSAMADLQTDYGLDLVELDVTDSASVTAAVKSVIAAVGRIDILVNNAGVVLLGPTAEVPLDSIKAGFHANVFGLIDMCQAVIPHMVRQGSGRIINIGSLTGFTPVPLRGIYSATKAAVMRLSDALRIELKPLEIQVMLVAPGFIKTNARDTAHNVATKYSSKSLWCNWLSVLESCMAKLLVNAVPADYYAKRLVAVALRRHMPRYWVGPCAGKEWLLRYIPLWLQDRLAYKVMGLSVLAPAMKQQQLHMQADKASKAEDESTEVTRKASKKQQ